METEEYAMTDESPKLRWSVERFGGGKGLVGSRGAMWSYYFSCPTVIGKRGGGVPRQWEVGTGGV